MNQWPGVKLRVTEGWDEEGHHAAGSLHYEGRAVDVTTSDRDRSKYGMLAKLAVEAGFDWVYYESRSHIHCSVKSESSQSVKSGGCFPGNAKVTTRSGEVSLSSLQVGDEVLVMDIESGEFKFSEVLLFLDRNPLQYRDFVEIETSSGRKIQVTPSHLIVAIKSSNSELDKELDGELLNNYRRTSDIYENEVTSDKREKVFISSTSKEPQIIFSSEIEIGDTLITVDNDKIIEDKVLSVNSSVHEGVFAPLTAEGTVVVNEIVTSCYAVVNSHSLAHFVYGPLRFYHNFEMSLKRMWESAFKPFVILKNNAQERSNEIIGIHWYANFLYSLAERILPSEMLYSN
ncbi:UNVERIFIED_CONTAM: hypothetical protein PYX00_007904 [Menopon gallinae]|uniref:Protein hedgehog n=1 Tax=Menopon gallinae TaxID=328185 RepID=A0AAW2HKV1_9NEOP